MSLERTLAPLECCTPPSDRAKPGRTSAFKSTPSASGPTRHSRKLMLCLRLAPPLIAISPQTLAQRTEMRTTIHECLTLDDRATARARFTVPAISIQRTGKVSRGTVDVDIERVEARPAGVQGARHDLTSSLNDPLGIWPSHGLRGTRIMHLGGPKRLIGVDISNTRDKSLVQQGAFEPSLPSH